MKAFASAVKVFTSATTRAPQRRGMSASLRRIAARHAVPVLAVSTLFVFGAFSAQAQATYQYQGSGTVGAPTSSIFSTGFTPTIVNGGTTTSATTTADTLSFGGATGAASYTATDDLTSTININALSFSNVAGVIAALARSANTGASNSLTLGGTAPTVTTSTGAVTNGLDLILASSATFSIGTGGFTQNGVVSGAGGLAKSGAGSMTLSGNNTYIGGTTINSGTLVLTGTNDVGNGAISVASGQLTLGSGTSTTNGNNALTATNAVTLASGTALNINQTNTPLTYAAFQINMNGNSSLVFSGGNSYTATVNSPIVINNTSGTQAATIGETDAANTIKLQGVISGTGDLKIAPGGNGNPFSVNLSQSETYTGNTFITQAAGTKDYPSVKLLSGGALPSGTVLTISGVLAPASTAKFTGLDLSGQSQMLAGLVSAGTAADDLVINSTNGTTAALTLNSTNSYSFGGSIGSSTLANTSNISLTKAGTGVQTLTSGNYYTGATTVNSGELFADSTTNLPLSTSTVTVNNGGNVTVGDHAGTVPGMINNFVLNGSGTNGSTVSTSGTSAYGALGFYNSGNFSLTGTVNLASNSLIRTDPVTQTGALTFTGIISGAGSLTLAGGGSAAGGVPHFTLTNANTYGTTTPATLLTSNGINTSPMLVELSTVNNVLPTSTVLTFGGTPAGQSGAYNSNVTLELDGISQQLAGIQTATGATGTYTVVGNSATASTFTINNVGSSTFSGIVGGTGTNNNNISLTKTGAGTQALTGTNTYTGGTTISSGTLSTTASGLGTGTVTNNTTLDLGGSSGTFANTVSGTGVLTVGGNTTNPTATGAIITMTATNSYTGGTTINSGTLSGDAGSYGSGAIIVASGATVDYTQSGATGIAANNISGAGTASFGGNTGNANGSGGTINYTGNDSATQTNVQSGTVTLNRTGGSALTGPVAVATGATVQLNADTQVATSALPSSAPTTAAVTLAGGTFNANGHSDGTISGTPTADPTTSAVTSSMGALSLGSGSTSILDFGATQGAGPFVLAFADSSGTLGSGLLNVLDYAGGTDALYIGTSASLSQSQLAQISFGGVGAAQLANGQITPAPEPATWAAFGIGLLGIGGLALHARRRASAA